MGIFTSSLSCAELRCEGQLGIFTNKEQKQKLQGESSTGGSPLDVNGEQPLHLQAGPADGGCKGFALAVTEEQHLQHVGVIH